MLVRGDGISITSGMIDQFSRTKLVDHPLVIWFPSPAWQSIAEEDPKRLGLRHRGNAAKKEGIQW